MTTSVDVEGISSGMEKFKAKKVLYAKWIDCTDEDKKQANRLLYKVARAKVKLAVTIVKKTTFERLYIELGDKGKDKKFYRLEKVR